MVSMYPQEGIMAVIKLMTIVQMMAKNPVVMGVTENNRLRDTRAFKRCEPTANSTMAFDSVRGSPKMRRDVMPRESRRIPKKASAMGIVGRLTLA